MAKSSARRSQAERTEETRLRLVKSAERIFARDGFEASKLEEICSRAGYTRGAFYVNFESKEDLFIAMLEREALERLAVVRIAVRESQGPDAQLKTLRKFVASSPRDQTWAVLFTEFKLFALRHPELKKKLADMHRRLFAATTETMDEVFASTGTKLPMSTLAFAVSIGGLFYSLELDRLVSNAVTEEEISTILGLLFDAVTKAKT
jgi:AcrR family transcriptional regulator